MSGATVSAPLALACVLIVSGASCVALTAQAHIAGAQTAKAQALADARQTVARRAVWTDCAAYTVVIIGHDEASRADALETAHALAEEGCTVPASGLPL